MHTPTHRSLTIIYIYMYIVYSQLHSGSQTAATGSELACRQADKQTIIVQHDTKCLNVAALLFVACNKICKTFITTMLEQRREKCHTLPHQFGEMCGEFSAASKPLLSGVWEACGCCCAVFNVARKKWFKLLKRMRIMAVF